ncbi:hypothetical protein PIB30_071457 [Stylosanthes scabra]|uniref:Uncharacterized protein n=1 Tax=Stylosanthes scabra TaxID=79078 RepID=A0ABU6ZMG4_9FABA|nr:hypothetical protein [Stylosanthes scabra]
MPYELYVLLDLGPLKTTKDVFTTADMGIVSIAGIAEDVLVKIGSLTLPADFHVDNVEEIYHPKRPPALNKKFALPVQLSSEDKKKKKDPMKKKVKIRNQGKESSKEESKEVKGKRRIELKCNSVEDLIGKLLTFKKVLHNNDAMSNHLVKDNPSGSDKPSKHPSPT